MKKTLLTISTITLLAPTILFAQSNIGQTLVNLPGLGAGATSFESYINTIYALTITIAAMLAVIKIVIAGVKYMTTDIVTTRGDAKKDIYGAVIGLLVVLAAVLIIEIINPDINDVTLAIETQQAPPRTADTSARPMAPYQALQGPGYTYIASDSSVGQLNQFEADCSGTFVRDFSSRQVRCNTGGNAAVLDTINTEITTGANPRPANDVIYTTAQYNTYVAPYEITSASRLATIKDSLGATQIYFAANMMQPNPSYVEGGQAPQNIIMSQVERGQFEGICQQIAEAQDNPNIGADINNQTNIAACVEG